MTKPENVDDPIWWKWYSDASRNAPLIARHALNIADLLAGVMVTRGLFPSMTEFINVMVLPKFDSEMASTLKVNELRLEGFVIKEIQHYVNQENNRSYSQDDQLTFWRFSGVACDQICAAIRSEIDGDVDDALRSLSAASHLVGIVMAYDLYVDENSGLGEIDDQIDLAVRRTISERARIAANAAHVENRAIKDAAFEWLDNNYIKDKLTIDRAAESLGALVPMEFSTRKRYVIDWRKSRRLARAEGS
ncbi:hypothetical protein [Paraburkholderia sp. MM6662-R1]|uniref:hypothetical protein n=1 Tax=Paraburkholderia sp. MM6662-R1 TaxID=2991066 RepID=UPI003D25667F